MGQSCWRRQKEEAEQGIIANDVMHLRSCQHATPAGPGAGAGAPSGGLRARAGTLQVYRLDGEQVLSLPCEVVDWWTVQELRQRLSASLKKPMSCLHIAGPDAELGAEEILAELWTQESLLELNVVIVALKRQWDFRRDFEQFSGSVKVEADEGQFEKEATKANCDISKDRQLLLRRMEAFYGRRHTAELQKEELESMILSARDVEFFEVRKECGRAWKDYIYAQVDGHFIIVDLLSEYE